MLIALPPLQWTTDVDHLAGRPLLTTVEQSEYHAPAGVGPWLPLTPARTIRHGSGDSSLATPFAVVPGGAADARTAAQALTLRFGGLDAFGVGVASDGRSFVVHLGDVRPVATGADPGRSDPHPLQQLGLPFHGLGITRRLHTRWTDVSPSLTSVFAHTSAGGAVTELRRTRPG